MNQHNGDPEIMAQIEDELEHRKAAQLEDDAEHRRALKTIDDFDHSLLDAIRRYDVKAIARIINRVNGKHTAGAVVLSVLLTNLYVFHRNSDAPATIRSVVGLGLMSFASLLIPIGIYYFISFCTSFNRFYGDDKDVSMGTRIRGFLIVLCACFGISALFVFGVIA